MPERPDVPVIGMVSRLVDQKGFDILAEIYESLMSSLDVQFVLLGTGDPHYHNVFSQYAQRYPEKTAIFLTFNASLSQKIYAGSDMFLMPSRFEPCGLGQMVAMHYGSIPIVRSTGGLADTVQNFDPSSGQGDGFAFERYDGMQSVRVHRARGGKLPQHGHLAYATGARYAGGLLLECLGPQVRGTVPEGPRRPAIRTRECLSFVATR